MGHALGIDQRGQFSARGHRRRGEDQGRADGGRAEQFEDRDIEGRRGDGQHPRSRGEAVPLPGFGGQVRNSGMGDHDTFGCPGGARGVDQVGRMLRPQRGYALGVIDRRGVGRRGRRGERRIVEGEPFERIR